MTFLCGKAVEDLCRIKQVCLSNATLKIICILNIPSHGWRLNGISSEPYCSIRF